MVLKVGVIGAGVIGLSSAIHIAEYYGPSAEVTVISDKFTPETTGDGSAGLWGPYLCGSTSSSKIWQWSKDTHDLLMALWTSEVAWEAGVCLFPITRVTTEDTKMDTMYRDIVYGAQELTETELKKLSAEHGKKYTSGMHFVSYTSEPAKFLPYLMKRFSKAGGKMKKLKIRNLYDYVKRMDYDIVVNCTGLGAQDIVKDVEMHSLRGQVTRVAAPWQFSIYLDESEDGNYIIPNCDSVVLGGTHQFNDYCVTPYVKDRKFIMNGCTQIMPNLKASKIINEWVGLRPGRTSVRLEKEYSDDGKLIIHNYGHGGCGVTLCWGCGKEVLNMIKNQKSKL